MAKTTIAAERQPQKSLRRFDPNANKTKKWDRQLQDIFFFFGKITKASVILQATEKNIPF